MLIRYRYDNLDKKTSGLGAQEIERGNICQTLSKSAQSTTTEFLKRLVN
jgi:hypothetical protein